MISVLVANPKGGCGKTTIATHLAAAFANGGLRTALADADRQHSSLNWLKARPETAAPINGLDWVKEIHPPPEETARLVIDSAAATRMGSLRDLVRAADIIVVPVLPSAFDIGATLKFLKRLRDLKPIKRNRKPFALVRNRVRTGTRAAKRLDGFVADAQTADAGWLPDRSMYDEVAWQGLSIFDLHDRRALDLQRDWVPLVRYVEYDGEPPEPPRPIA